ncbi:MAG: bifunctional folylpolyglutamate synthase/dihydrofolate synthase, partial [Flavisolibacter sp.]
LLCEELGNPHEKFKSIHVGGTNGKGSVSHMLAAILQSQGIKTGLYTSPHLYDFRERIKIDGVMVHQEFVVDFVQRIRPMIEKIHPSFFEITVAMAFEYFVQQEIEIAVVEVGLGGRLDSTNIITPVLSIITNIGWDHMNLLGNSLEEIASEKAGIIKAGVPVIIGERQTGTDVVFENYAVEKNAPLYFASDELESTAYKWNSSTIEIEVHSKTEQKNQVWETDLQGIYQGKNICTVLKACAMMGKTLGSKFILPQGVITSGLKNVKLLTGLHGRWEKIHIRPDVVLEVAHNPDGIKQMLLHLNHIPFEQLRIVIGMVRDKDVDEVLKMLPPGAQYYFTQSKIPRALDAMQLKQKAAGLNLEGNTYEDVNQALGEALKESAKDDLVIVCGSIFLVAEVNRESVAQFT